MRALLASVALLGAASAAGAGERVAVARFAEAGLAGWQARSFAGETRYRLVEAGDRGSVLEAVSEGTASALYREIEVDLRETPWLNWSWRVDGVLDGLDPTTKAGDDYPARIYLVVEGFLPWRSRALNYVWANAGPSGRSWPNPFTGRARMFAVEGGAERAGEWLSHRRNVRADFRRLFGDDVERIDGVAIMTDSDNSGRSARAWYGDIHFSAE